jgi:hypothetical protein
MTTVPQWLVSASIAYQRSKAELHWHEARLIVHAPDKVGACALAKSAWSVSGYLVRKPVARPGPTCEHTGGFPCVNLNVARCQECGTPQSVYVAQRNATQTQRRSTT